MTKSHAWEASTGAALETTFYQHSKWLEIRGMKNTSEAFHDRLSGNRGAGHWKAPPPRPGPRDTE